MKLRLNLKRICIYILIMSVSFDTFANLKIGGYSFRLCQIVSIVLIILTLVQKQIIIPRGMKTLILFAVINTIFIINSILLKNGVGYGLWLWFNIVVVIALYSYCANSLEACQWVIKVFLESFFYLSLLAVAQFVLGLLHIDFYIQQWWLGGMLPRVSGFSYEPSYYSTYLIAGWAVYAYMLENTNEILSKGTVKFRFIMITVAMLLSTSRMSWLMMILWGVRLIFLILKDCCKGRTTMQHLRVYILIFFGICSLICLLLVIHYNFFDLSFLLLGLGKNGSSSSTRINGMLLLLAKWRESPFIGVSLGGIGPLVASMRNISLSNVDNVNKIVSSPNITAELLVATGVLGCFLFYFSLLREIKVAIVMKDTICKGMAYGLGMIVLILQFNQNILRPYLWIDIAMLYIALEYFRLRRIGKKEI